MRTRFAQRGLIAVAALAIAGCQADRVSGPVDRPPQPTRPSAAIEDLTAEPILADNRWAAAGGNIATYHADDFTVPVGATWTVTQVVISGVVNAATLPIAIRADNNAGVGGVLPDASFNIAATSSTPNVCACGRADYLFTLPTPVILTAGTYWLTVGPTSDPLFGDPDLIWMRRPIVGAAAQVSEDGNSWGPFVGDRAFVIFGTRVRQPQTITFPAIAPPSAAVGGTTTLSATASSGLSVSYTSLTTGVCTVSGSTLAYIGAGNCTVAADQAGDGSYEPAARETQQITVGKGAQAVTFTSTPPTPALVGATYTVAATGGASSVAVTFSSLSTGVCTVSGNTVSFIAAGTCTVGADQAGNNNYLAAEQVTQNITVSKRGQTSTFVAIKPNPAIVGSSATLSATATSGLAVSYREDPVGHTIAPGGLAQAVTVLFEALG